MRERIIRSELECQRYKMDVIHYCVLINIGLQSDNFIYFYLRNIDFTMKKLAYLFILGLGLVLGACSGQSDEGAVTDSTTTDTSAVSEKCSPDCDKTCGGKCDPATCDKPCCSKKCSHDGACDSTKCDKSKCDKSTCNKDSLSEGHGCEPGACEEGACGH
jgi:hypothetical protein